MLQIYARRVTQKNMVVTEYRSRMHVHCTLYIHKRGHSPRTEMKQVGTARIEFRKATKGNGIGMEGNRRNQRRSRKRTESDQIRNCKGRLMYRKFNKKEQKGEKRYREKQKKIKHKKGTEKEEIRNGTM